MMQKVTMNMQKENTNVKKECNPQNIKTKLSPDIFIGVFLCLFFVFLTTMNQAYIKKTKSIPSVFKNIEDWQVNRRKFVKAMGVTAIASQIGFINSCTSQQKEVYEENEYLTALQAEIIQRIQEVLFPDDGNGPSINDIKAYEHFLWVLSDKRKPKSSIEYYVNGIDWSEETAQENYAKSFSELNDKEVENLVAIIADESWGKSWLSIIITFIFEALALDPIYNINTDKSGWEWLGQFEGTPRPNENITYDKIFKTIGAE